MGQLARVDLPPLVEAKGDPSVKNIDIVTRVWELRVPGHKIWIALKYSYTINIDKRGRKEGNVLFNDALNTFYLRLYGVGHMVKYHTDSERGNPLPPHGLLFPISSECFLYAPSHRQDNTYHGLCYTSRGALAGTKKIRERFQTRRLCNDIETFHDIPL